MELWMHGVPVPGRVVELAVRAEEWGLDGLLVADSELLVGDPYIELALAANATTRLRLGPAVTNPVTRHAAVTAAAIATVRDLVRGSAAIFAHFVSEGPSSVLSEADRAAVEPLSTGYVERDHGLGGAAHTLLLPDDFLDRVTVIGPPDHDVERLRALGELGIQRLILVSASRDADPTLVTLSNELLAPEVLPHLT